MAFRRWCRDVHTAATAAVTIAATSVTRTVVGMTSDMAFVGTDPTKVMMMVDRVITLRPVGLGCHGKLWTLEGRHEGCRIVMFGNMQMRR